MASPRRAMEALRKAIAAGWPPGLTVLGGSDAYHLDIAQRELLGALVPDDASEFALSVFGAEKVDVSTVVSSARSLGMFAPCRVVLVRDVAALDGDPASLVDYAKAPPPSSYLIVRAPALDRRRKLHQALAKQGRVVSFDRAEKPREILALAPDVAALAAEKGLKLGRGVGALLVEACAGDFYRVDTELEKIRAWLGEAPEATVTERTIRELAADAGLLSGFEIAEAVLARDRGAALAAVRRLTDSGEPPIRLLGALAWRCRWMVQVKAALESGRSASTLERSMRGAGRVDSIVRGVGRYTMDELVRFPSYLLAADRTLKSRAIDPRAVLEQTVDRMIGGAAGG